jgi:hypothetical protein
MLNLDRISFRGNKDYMQSSVLVMYRFHGVVARYQSSTNLHDVWKECRRMYVYLSADIHVQIYIGYTFEIYILFD